MKSKRGFTLLEILFVVAIIGILATITAVSVQSVRINARDARRISDFNAVRTALLQYYQQNRSYPSSITPGSPLLSPDGKITYFDAVPVNPSPQGDEGCPDRDYSYSPSTNNASFALTSCIGRGTSGSEIITLTPEGIIRTPNPFGWWSLDTGDGSSTVNSGSIDMPIALNGGYTWEPAENCRLGSCLSFDGTTGNGTFTLPALPQYTVSVWVKRLSDQETEAGKMDESQIFSSSNDHVGLTIQYYSPSNTTDTRFLFWDGGILTSTTQADLDTFYHVVINSDGTTKKLYINGALEGSDTANYSILSGTAKIGEGFNSGRNLNAIIDDFRIFKRALTEKEVLDLYNSAG